MNLLESKEKSAKFGVSAHRVELWDMGKGYKVRVFIDKRSCNFYISLEKRDVTLEVAKLLGVNTQLKDITLKPADDVDLYLKFVINSITLVYRKSENYEKLLRAIEVIVNKNF